MTSGTLMISNQIPRQMQTLASAGNNANIDHAFELRVSPWEAKWREFLLILLMLLGLLTFATESFGQELTSSSEVSYLGATTQAWAGLSATPGQPAIITLDNQGDLIVADPTHGVVTSVPIAGGSQKVLLSNTASITAIASDTQGDVFVATSTLSSVIKISAGSTTTTNIGSGLSNVQGLTVNQQGDVIVADAGNNRIVSINPAGVQSVIYVNIPYPTAVYCDPQNSLYVASRTGITAYWFNGQVYQIGQNWSQPTTMTEAGNGNLLVVDSGSHQLVQVSAANGNKSVISWSSDPRKIVSLIGDVHGNLFAYDENQAQILKLDNGINFGSVAVGSQSASYTLTYQFQENTTLANIATVTKGTLDGQLSMTGGSCITYFTYQPGQTCTIVVSVSPKYAGSWNGDLTLIDTSGNDLIDVETFANGLAAVQVLLPGRAQTYYQNPYSYTGELIPSSLAVDASGNLYVGDDANSRVLEVAPTGDAQVLFTGTKAQPLGEPLAITLDGKGDLYIADDSLAWGLSPNLGTPGTLRSNIFYAIPYGQWGGEQEFVAYMTGLVVQPDGGFIFSDSGDNRIVAVDNTGAGTDLISASLPIGTSQQPLGYPMNLAYAPDGSLLIVDFDNSRIVKRSPTGIVSEAIPAGMTLAGAALNAPMGIAVDSAGNIYVGDTGNNRVVGITPQGSSWVVLDSNSLIDGSSQVPLSDPQTLALDPQGNLFVADVGNERVLKIDRSAQNMVFDATDAGKQSAPLTVEMQNIGNQSLNLSNFAVTSSNPVFPIASATTCTNQMSLSVNSSCQIAVQFAPNAPGNYVGSLSISSNSQAISGTVATVTLAGSTSAIVDHLSFTALPSTVTAGSPFNYTVAAEDIHGNPVVDYRGTVQVTWSSHSSPTLYTFQAADAGTHTFTGAILTQAGIASVTVQDQATSSLSLQGSLLVYPAAPASLSIVSGSGQSANVNQAFAEPLGASVLDAYGNLVAGAPVTFSAPASGASAIDSGNAFPVSTYTDSTGAAYINISANGTAGSYSVKAALASNANVTFNLTNNALQTPQAIGSFTLSATPTVTTFDANGEAATTLSIQPENGFTGKVQLSCTAPAGVDCAMGEASISIPSAAASSAAGAPPIQVLIKKSNGTVAILESQPVRPPMQAAMAIAFLLGVFGLSSNRYRRWDALACAFVLAIFASVNMIGCSAKPSDSQDVSAQTSALVTIKITAEAELPNSNLVQKTVAITVEPFSSNAPRAGGPCAVETSRCLPIAVR